MQAYVRFRNLHDSDVPMSRNILIQKNSKGVLVVDRKHCSEKKYTFDHVFGPETTQAKVYETLNMDRVIQQCLHQRSSLTMLTYGQTGSGRYLFFLFPLIRFSFSIYIYIYIVFIGKTFSMFGDLSNHFIKSSNSNSAGVVVRVIRSLFSCSVKKMKIDFVELYQNKVYDLLTDTSDMTPLKVRVQPYSTVLDGLSQHKPCCNANQVFKHISHGLNKRRVASTNLNRSSSRSHALLTLTLPDHHMKITFVDLAVMIKTRHISLIHRICLSK